MNQDRNNSRGNKNSTDTSKNPGTRSVNNKNNQNKGNGSSNKNNKNYQNKVNGIKNTKVDNKKINNQKNTIFQKPYLVAGIAIGVIILIIILVFALNNNKNSSKTAVSNSSSIATSNVTSTNSNQQATAIKTVAKTGTDFDSKKDLVVIEMQDGSIIKLELYPDQAPITVANFVKLVNEKFYDGLKFHRVMKGFMIQGGDPQGTGMGGSAKTIKGEFTQNGVKNNILHTKGVISMARSSSMDSASSQFFIMHGTSTSLDGSYAAFGRVVDGLAVVDTIANVECDNSNPQSPSPLVPQIMKQIRIETRA